MPYDEFAYHTPEAKAGVLFIRALPDDELMQAMDSGTNGHLKVRAFMGKDTNPNWITSQAAETAYFRGLITEKEFDWRTE